MQTVSSDRAAGPGGAARTFGLRHLQWVRRRDAEALTEERADHAVGALPERRAGRAADAWRP